MEDLKERTHRFIDELGVIVAKFARNVGIGHSTLYRWWSGDIELSERLENKIDEYLRRYGY